jgi:hypothetical protein
MLKANDPQKTKEGGETRPYAKTVFASGVGTTFRTSVGRSGSGKLLQPVTCDEVVVTNPAPDTCKCSFNDLESRIFKIFIVIIIYPPVRLSRVGGCEFTQWVIKKPPSCIMRSKGSF